MTDSQPATALEPRILNDKKSIPAIGFGSFPHHGEDSAEMVTNALDLGYRLIDTAFRYENEREVGEAALAGLAGVLVALTRSEKDGDTDAS